MPISSPHKDSEIECVCVWMEVDCGSVRERER